MRILLAAGADVNLETGRYGSALVAAADRGHEEIVSKLIAAGADIDFRHSLHGSALERASLRGRENVVHVLLQAYRERKGSADVGGSESELSYRRALLAASNGACNVVPKDEALAGIAARLDQTMRDISPTEKKIKLNLTYRYTGGDVYDTIELWPETQIRSLTRIAATREHVYHRYFLKDQSEVRREGHEIPLPHDGYLHECGITEGVKLVIFGKR